MTGLVRSTNSPSSSSMRRSTPCVEGCAGPMLMIMVSSSRRSKSTSLGSRVRPLVAQHRADLAAELVVRGPRALAAVSWRALGGLGRRARRRRSATSDRSDRSSRAPALP